MRVDQADKRSHKLDYRWYILVCSVSHLLSVLSPGGVKALYEVGGVAQEHGVAGRATDHTQHGQPHVSQGLGGKPPVADTEHVGHRLGKK